MLKTLLRLVAMTVGIVAALSILGCVAATSQESASFEQQRQDMVRTQLTRGIFGRTPVEDEDVLEAMRTVPRHVFVPEPYRPDAYRDTPLPIGHDQTISQPYVVATMTALVEPGENDIVLEVGTGSGYQAAVLGEIVKEVYTIEIVSELGERARKTLKELSYDNVHVRIGDGYRGWPEHAPFDAIVVTAAPDHIPEPLIEQLKPGGRMIIPVGPEYEVQKLTLVTKTEGGEIAKETVDLVRFVPFTGEAQEKNN